LQGKELIIAFAILILQDLRAKGIIIRVIIPGGIITRAVAVRLIVVCIRCKFFSFFRKNMFV
jgi:hypothetical protein